MNNYEAVIIFRTDLENEAREELLSKYKSAIEEDGTIESVDDWGARKLAYEINYIKEGYYYIVNFKSNPAHIREFERRLRLSDKVIRYMVIRKED